MAIRSLVHSHLETVEILFFQAADEVLELESELALPKTPSASVTAEVDPPMVQEMVELVQPVL